MRYFLIFLLFITGCSSEEKPATTGNSAQTDTITAIASSSEPDTVAKPLSKLPDKDFTFKVLKNENGYGYDIYSAGKMVIHQPIIPGAPGNNGFKTESEAFKVATLVVFKLSNNIMPPSVTQQEIDSVVKQ